MNDLYYTTIEKYGYALCGQLYPAQIKQLQSGLEYYQEYGKLPEIKDAYTRLAFMMIVSDLKYQEKKGGVPSE